MSDETDDGLEPRPLNTTPEEPEPRPELPIEEAIESIGLLSERAYESVSAYPDDGYGSEGVKARDAYAGLGAALATAVVAFRRATVMLK